MITNIELFFLLLYTAGVINVSYFNYAFRKKFEPKPWLTEKEFFILFFSELIIYISPIVAFFFIEWYLVFIYLFLGILLSKMVYLLIKKQAWVIGISLSFIAWVFLIIEI